MASIEGRVLNPPAVKYHGDRKVNPSNGQWSIQNETFYKTTSIQNWALVIFPSERYFNGPW